MSKKIKTRASKLIGGVVLLSGLVMSMPTLGDWNQTSGLLSKTEVQAKETTKKVATKKVAKATTFKGKYNTKTVYKKKYPKTYASINNAVLNRKTVINVNFKELPPNSKDYDKELVNILYEIDYNNPTKIVDRYHYTTISSYGTEYYTNKSTYKLTLKYRYTKAQTTKYVNKTNTKVASIAKSIAKPSDSDYKKVKAVHDYLKKTVKYDYSALKKDYDEAHLPYGGLINKKGVCDTYAKSAERLLNYMGVEAGYMQGYGGGDDHSWNWVKIDGKVYYMDITWDTTAKTSDYFLVNSETLAKDHQWDAENYPKATSTKYLKKAKK